MSARPLLAIDWGTTNRRVYRIEDGAVTATERDALGVTSVSDFAGELAAIRARLGDVPVLMAGMVGSTIGWREARYVPAPAGLDDLRDNLLRIDDRTAIVPGVSFCDGARGDVMRGEEVQLLGAVAAGLTPPDALLVQPGTHCKWVEMAGSRIARFTTAMTGELFALVRAHGILSAQLGADVVLGDAFRDGVREGTKRDLTASLFGIRAAKLLGLRDDADAASFGSGLIIGADVAARVADNPFETAYILADPVLGGLYAAAIEVNGRAATIIDSHAAFVAGISRIGASLS
ncbi:2-dehydro-3-deoxygalactonokinase [Sphingomonas asaccharolytica]|uniref:2-dehydro-3-deoxygalactonokinase n=1 Tax=Sphingomonas asaccharolytica TaxID=40681 RepID=UPI000836C4E8|nr:2-dehydro-3-deoxygalactonokinase [Sphingomonas asaccharolytica]